MPDRMSLHHSLEQRAGDRGSYPVKGAYVPSLRGGGLRAGHLSTNTSAGRQYSSSKANALSRPGTHTRMWRKVTQPSCPKDRGRDIKTIHCFFHLSLLISTISSPFNRPSTRTSRQDATHHYPPSDTLRLLRSSSRRHNPPLLHRRSKWRVRPFRRLHRVLRALGLWSLSAIARNDSLVSFPISPSLSGIAPSLCLMTICSSYRCRNVGRNLYLMTSDAGCEGASGFQLEGNVMFIYANQVEGTNPLDRYYNSQADHL